MHASIADYLAYLAAKGRSPLTIKAARGDLTGFATWWETQRDRPFDPALLRESDLHAWRLARQKEDGAAPATINRALVTFRTYCGWAKQTGLIPDNPAEDIKAIPTGQAAPKSLPAEAVDAILRAMRTEKDERIRLRDEALLVLLVHAGLRAQEVCDIQLRDLDLDGGNVTIRYGKGGRMRRVLLNTEALALLHRYISRLRCVQGLPTIGSDAEREPLLVGFDRTSPGRRMHPGVNQRLVQRVVGQRAHQAAERLRLDTQSVSSLERIGVMLDLAQRLEQTTPHTLRHSLARRLIESGADLAVVQRTLGHSSIATTSLYLTPSDDDLRAAMERVTPSALWIVYNLRIRLDRLNRNSSPPPFVKWRHKKHKLKQRT